LHDVHFHPTGELCLTAGYDKTLRFFAVDGENNPKIHGVFFPDLPITCASFVNGGSSVVLSGRRPFFYTYDVTSGVVEKIPKIAGRKEKSLEKFIPSPDGRIAAFVGADGYIILVSCSTWEWIGEVKMAGTCRAVAFSPCSTYLHGSGSDGDVYRWDVRRLGGVGVGRFKNEDGSVTASLAVSAGFTAVGAESGVVNLYDDQRSVANPYNFTAMQAAVPEVRKPYKSIFNISTSADYMKFNHTGEILAIASRREKDTLKLVHMPTGNVFQNWPTTKTPLGYVWSLDFSPKSGYVAMGNDKGKCLLYRLGHFNES